MKATMTMILIAAMFCGATIAQQKSVGTVSNAPQDTKPVVPKIPEPPEFPRPDLAPNMPSSEIRMLTSFMMGNWNLVETFEHNENLPHGGEMKGTENIHQGPGGLSLISDVHASGTFGEFTAMRFMLWDPKAKAVIGFWQDSFAPVVTNFSGTWANNTLTIDWTDETNGKKTEVREAFSGFSPQGFQGILETRSVPEAGNRSSQVKPTEWKHVMTVKYTKFVPAPVQWHPGFGPRPANLPPTAPPPTAPPPTGKPPEDGKPKG